MPIEPSLLERPLIRENRGGIDLSESGVHRLTVAELSADRVGRHLVGLAR